MKIAIASPSCSIYSETFIRMQMEDPFCALRIFGGPIASNTHPGGAISPLSNIRGLFDIVIECGLRSKRIEGPQAAELGRRLKKYKISALLANYGPTGVALQDLCLKHNIPLVVHFHGYDAHMESVTKKFAEKYRKLGHAASAIVAVSQSMVSALIDLGIPEEKIRLVRCGASSQHFRARETLPDDPLFLGVGRFVDKKAPYLTLLAFAQTLKEVPNAKLILAGDGELIETTRNLSEFLKIEKSVTFPGVLSSNEVSEKMQQATAFVQHSIKPVHGPQRGDREGTPVAILEAMISGVPVISTKHAGIGEVIKDGITGFLIEERDVNNMARAMVKLSTDNQLNCQIGARARDCVLNNFTDRHYLDALKKILELASTRNKL